MRLQDGPWRARPSQREMEDVDDVDELREAVMEDNFRKGTWGRLKGRKGNGEGTMKKSGSKASELAEERKVADAALVKKVMETGGGDAAALARKIHERFDRAGVRQPSVEVRFDKVSISTMAPVGSTGGLFTVGVDLKTKVFKGVSAVTRKKPPMDKFTILHDVTGVYAPGRITLLLGPPGGGKTTLMQALCGMCPLPVGGAVTYNGHTQDEFNVRRTCRYVAQSDLHNPSLTVRETLTFSAKCQGPGYQRSMLRLLEEKEAKLGIEPDAELKELMGGLHHDDDPSANVALVLQMLQLTGCADTIVGDGMVRGVSGGEKKRVTTGEIVVGPSKVLFMDEISTGLDSASTFTIVQSLANVTRATDATIVVALLQPEPQTYDLFDDVHLLANGRTMYHGPRDAVEPWFASLGFEVVGKKAVADFLQELVSKKDQPPIRVNRSKFEPNADFVPAPAFSAAFLHSDVHKRTRAALDKPFDKDTAHPGALMKSRYGVPGWESVKALFWRERILLTANKQSQKYRYFQMAFLAFMLATLLVRHRVTTDDDLAGVAGALGAMFFSIAYMQFLGLAECAETMQRLPVFYKHRGMLMHPGWAYAVPFAVIRTPIILLEVTFWSIVVYWIVGLETSASRFFTLWGTLFWVQMFSSSFYRFIGSSLRSIVVGVSTAVVSMLLLLLGSGYMLLHDQIPDWWIWLFWVSPLQYTFTGLVNNELLGASYEDAGDLPPDLPGLEDGLGRFALNFYQFNIGNKWRWIAPLVLIAYYCLFNILNICALTFLPPPPSPPPPPPVQEEEYALARRPNASSRRSLEGGAASAKSNAAPLAAASPGAGAGAVRPSALADGADGERAADGAAATNGAADAGEAAAAAVAEGEAAGLNLPFEPVTLTFRGLKYFVPNPAGGGELELLKGIHGVFRPGVLTALMGASGAGKTTLMDVLADRKTAGRMEGTVKVNGHDKEPKSFARVMGYCEQFDTHSSGATVREALETSAMLRLSPDISKEQRKQFVDECLGIVELDVIAGQVVGMPGVFGLTGEQFKRLTIAVELVANPSIIFCDEPTSGLDARAAQIVMRVVRNIVNNNRTIVCTIHQPSAEIFLHFDELLLLKRGGSTIYYGPLGPESETLVDYFQSVPDAKQLARGYNPATYMLEATTQSEEERLGVDFGDLWNERQKEKTIKMVQEAEQPREGSEPIHFDSEYSQGRLVQYKVLAARYWKSYWRSPPYNTTRLILSAIAGLIIGSAYWSRGDNYEDTEGVTAILGALFVSVSFIGFINFQMIIPTFAMERPVMWRERASRLYSVLPWVQSMQDVEIPWILAQTLLFSLIVYFMIHFEYDAAKFLFFWLNLSVSVATMAYLGMTMVAITPNLQMGVTLGATFLGSWFVFAGFIVTRPNMPPWWRWFSYLCPPSWSIYAICVDQLGERDEEIEYFIGSELRTTSISEYLQEQFNYHYNWKWGAFGVSLVFAIALRLIVAAATKYLNFQKR